MHAKLLDLLLACLGIFKFTIKDPNRNTFKSGQYCAIWRLPNCHGCKQACGKRMGDDAELRYFMSISYR
jgi:hypothetical protein